MSNHIKKMSNKIPFTFRLDSKKKIGFSTESLDESLLNNLELYLHDGILINNNFYDDLFNDTVSYGHNLLKCNGIFTLDTSVVESMSIVIGKFLFRLLFTTTAAFRECLHKAKQTADTKIEIKLEFDLLNEDSKELAQLPWELMYCPESQANEDADADDDTELPGGFFLSREAVIYREYKKYALAAAAKPRQLFVAVAFLTKDTDNLYPFYTAQKAIAATVENNNPNIHFEFINLFDEQQKTGELLSKSDLSKVFLKDDKYKDADKIVHLICDVDTTPAKAGGDSRAFYFNKYGSEVEKIAFAEVYRYLTDCNILPDPRFKLLVLQAWKDTNKYNYAGFEEFAGKVIRMNKDNQTAILSMPYVLKEAGSKKEMNPVFFSSLYTAFSKSQTILDVVKTVRNIVVPKYSYGFPLFYFSGSDIVLATDTPVTNIDASLPGGGAAAAAPGEANPAVEPIKKMLRYLDYDKLIKLEDQLRNLKLKKHENKPTNKIDTRIKAVQQLKKEKNK